jgi:dihydropyrimidinase
MSAARKLGLLVQVHCENAPLIDALVADALRAEALPAESPHAESPHAESPHAEAPRAESPHAEAPRAEASHAETRPAGARPPGAGDAGAGGGSGHPGARIFADTRPPEVEEEAVARTLAVASLAGAPCYLVHLSSAGSVEQVRLARRRGQRGVFAEVCTHHLLLDDTRYAGADAERYLVCPPLRDRSDVGALWEGLADGTIDTVGSDHCQVKSSTTGPLSEAGICYTYGLAGVGPRLPLLLSAAVARGLPIERVARLAAENPARAFGHYPAKGALAPGSDADVVIFDPEGDAVLPEDGFGDCTGDSVYAGLAVRGRIRAVLLRGELIVSGGVLVDDRRLGRYRSSADAAS